MIQITFSVQGVPVRLTPERWEHITKRHPELTGQEERVLEAVGNPDEVQRGDLGTLLAVKRQDSLYLVVVYRELADADGFVVTAYLAERLRRREVVWKL